MTDLMALPQGDVRLLDTDLWVGLVDFQTRLPAPLSGKGA